MGVQQGLSKEQIDKFKDEGILVVDNFLAQEEVSWSAVSRNFTTYQRVLYLLPVIGHGDQKGLL